MKPDLPMHEWVMALPLHPCTDCQRLSAGVWCEHYQSNIPEPGRPCRCIRFEQKQPALPWN